MFENYKQLSADEKAQIKSIHKALRAETPTRAAISRIRTPILAHLAGVKYSLWVALSTVKKN